MCSDTPRTASTSPKERARSCRSTPADSPMLVGWIPEPQQPQNRAGPPCPPSPARRRPGRHPPDASVANAHLRVQGAPGDGAGGCRPGATVVVQEEDVAGRSSEARRDRRMKGLTLAVAGISGCIGTTIAAGLVGLRRRPDPTGLLTELAWPTGSGRATSLASRLGLAPLSSMRVIGWDVDTRPLAESIREKGIVPADLAQTIAAELHDTRPLPAIAGRRAEALRGAREQLRKLRADGHDVVLVDILPAVETPAACDAHGDIDAFEQALMADDPAITPSMVYAWLALTNENPYPNFTSNVSVELPALRALAQRKRTPFCGKDGKTGQTLLKTTLAPMLALRGLRVRGWISANYLGNADGENLSHPEHAVEKLRNKL